MNLSKRVQKKIIKIIALDKQQHALDRQLRQRGSPRFVRAKRVSLRKLRVHSTPRNKQIARQCDEAMSEDYSGGDDLEGLVLGKKPQMWQKQGKNEQRDCYVNGEAKKVKSMGLDSTARKCIFEMVESKQEIFSMKRIEEDLESKKTKKTKRYLKNLKEKQTQKEPEEKKILQILGKLANIKRMFSHLNLSGKDKIICKKKVDKLKTVVDSLKKYILTNKDRMETQMRYKALSVLPVLKISGEILDCPVCWEPFKKNQMARKLPCKHLLHSSCFDNWFEINNKCPICNFKVVSFVMCKTKRKICISQDEKKLECSLEISKISRNVEQAEKIKVNK